MPESYQQEHREIEAEDAKIWADDENDVEGYVDGSKLMKNTDFILSAVATAANNFALGKIGYLAAAGTITLADADASADVERLTVIALGTIAGGAQGNFQLPLGVKVTMATHGFALGAPLYISATGGDLTTTAPGAGDFRKVVGYALDANTILFVGGTTIIAGS